MSTKKTYSIGSMKQLIDLNGSSTNFELTFRVNSHNKEPFDMLVVDQTTLDSNPSLEYKHVANGEMTGSLKNDKNVYQNYFLIIKAEKPCQCDVEINKREMPIQQKPVPPPAPAPEPKSSVNWIKIGLILLCVSIGGYILYRLSKKEKTDDKIPAVVQSTVIHPKAPSVRSSSSESYHPPVNSAVERLKRLNVY